VAKNSEKQKLAQSNPEAKVFDKFYKTERGNFLNQEICRSPVVNWNKKNTENCHILMVGYPVSGLLEGIKKAKSFSAFLPKFLGEKKVEWNKNNVSVLGDEAHLSFLPGSYNAAFVFHGLEYMEDPQNFLEGLWKTLTPDGKLMIMVPNKMAGWKRSGIPGQNQVNAFAYREIRNLLEICGFSLVDSYGIFYGLPVGFFRKLFFSGLLKTLSGGSIVGFPGFLIFEAEKSSGPEKVKFKDPTRIAPGVKTSPEFIPE
jgi:SAM-dependent methyltransferase